MAWYCHQCQNHIEILHDLKCPNCDGEFVEELSSTEEEDPAGPSGNNPRIVIVRNNVIDGNNPLQAFQAIFGGGNNNLFGQNFQRTTSDSSTTTAPSSDTSQDDNNLQPTIVDFFNQLIGNLAEGANEHRIQFNISNIGDYASDGGLDNIVTHLLNQFENTGQVDSISAEDIVNLPMTNVNEKQIGNGTQCATCMETFILNENVACLDCQHIFHRPCIEPWLRKHNTCPICRKVVDPKKWIPKPIFNDIDELD